MRIVIAADHAGFELKQELAAYLRNELGHDVEDCGAHTHDPEDDYPTFVIPAARAVSASPDNVRGIILGGSGQGEAMCANRFPHVRATVFYGGDLEIVRLSRAHNNANILALGARFLDVETARQAVKLWLTEAPDAGEKYARRIAQVEQETESN